MHCHAGLELVLYYHTLKFALDARTRRKRAYANGPVGDDANCSTILTLSTTLLVMTTIYIFTQSSFGEVTWVIDINDIGYPGRGSRQCAADYMAVWYRVAGSTVSVVMNWVAGPYLVRVFSRLDPIPVVLTSIFGYGYDIDPSRNRRLGWPKQRDYRADDALRGNTRFVLSCPLVYLGTNAPLCLPAVLGIPMCYYGGPLGGGFFVDTVAPRIAMAYAVIVALMNVICTFLICGRILYVSGEFSIFTKGGIPDDSSPRRSTQDSRIFLYRLAALMAVDSMLPHTLFGAAYVIALALGSPVYILFLSLYVMFTVCALAFQFRRLFAEIGTLIHTSLGTLQCLSPQMLMLRVVMGCEWRADRVHRDEQSSSPQFSGFTKPEIDTRTFHPHQQPGHRGAFVSLSDTHTTDSM